MCHPRPLPAFRKETFATAKAVPDALRLLELRHLTIVACDFGEAASLRQHKNAECRFKIAVRRMKGSNGRAASAELPQKSDATLREDIP